MRAMVKNRLTHDQDRRHTMPVLASTKMPAYLAYLRPSSQKMSGSLRRRWWWSMVNSGSAIAETLLVFSVQVCSIPSHSYLEYCPSFPLVNNVSLNSTPLLMMALIQGEPLHKRVFLKLTSVLNGTFTVISIPHIGCSLAQPFLTPSSPSWNLKLLSLSMMARGTAVVHPRYTARVNEGWSVASGCSSES